MFLWGLCVHFGMGFLEFGTVSLNELESYRGRLGLGIKRDRHFKARGPISAYIEAANHAERIVKVYEGGDGTHPAPSLLP